jgi:hypothetical protein
MLQFMARVPLVVLYSARPRMQTSQCLSLRRRKRQSAGSYLLPPRKSQCSIRVCYGTVSLFLKFRLIGQVKYGIVLTRCPIRSESMSGQL